MRYAIEESKNPAGLRVLLADDAQRLCQMLNRDGVLVPDGPENAVLMALGESGGGSLMFVRGDLGQDGFSGEVKIRVGNREGSRAFGIAMPVIRPNEVEAETESRMREFELALARAENGVERAAVLSQYSRGFRVANEIIDRIEHGAPVVVIEGGSDGKGDDNFLEMVGVRRKPALAVAVKTSIKLSMGLEKVRGSRSDLSVTKRR